MNIALAFRAFFKILFNSGFVYWDMKHYQINTTAKEYQTFVIDLNTIIDIENSQNEVVHQAKQILNQ